MKLASIRNPMILRWVLMLCSLLVQPVAQSQEWSGFEWIRASWGDKTYDKAAIYLPVRIPGLKGEYYMQLDTGASRTMLYEVPYKQVLQAHNAPIPQVPRGKSSNRFSPASFSGSIGRLGLTDFPVALYRDYGVPISRKDKHPKIGTVGLDMFTERPLILDFLKRRFAVLGKGESIPPGLEQRANFFEVTVRDGFLFIPVFYDEQPLDYIFYDTGTIFPLVTTRSLWQTLTGRSGDEPDNEHPTISAWGKRFAMTGARMKKSLRVGPVNVGRAMVYFAPPEADNLNFEKRAFKVSGLVGNEPFYDDYVVIIDLPRKRMAILRSK